MVTPPDTLVTEPARGDGVAPRRRSLLIVTGEVVDARPLPLSGTLTVGRGRACDLVVDHPSISRTHLTLQLTDRTIAVIDRGGTNGTHLRGAQLPVGVAVEIVANEALAIGDVTLVVQEVRAVAPGAPAEVRPSGLVAPSSLAPLVIDPRMQRLYELAARLARGTLSLLVVGETGTGKEVLAEFIHRSSSRAGGPLLRVNCAAFAESVIESELFGHERGAFTGALRDRRGLLESAEGGTVVLDEVGEFAPAIQAKLLRALEERAVWPVGSSTPRPIDVRFVASTNRDLEAEVAAGRFRRDLYFRLAGAVLAIPPLRERPDEIVALAGAFATAAAARDGLPPPRLHADALAALRREPWPGNVRELRNAIERAVLLTSDGAITAEHLAGARAHPGAVAPVAVGAVADAAPLADQLAALERQRILDAVAACDGNQTRAAAALGMPRRTLVKRLTQYGAERPRKRD